MAETQFDPYYHWLSVPPRLQPPNLYRLLGLELFEEHPEVIASAADRQMSYVRSFQAGKHGVLSQRLLNEIAAARICLLNPLKKEEYDSRLRSQNSAAADEEETLEFDGAAFGEYLLEDHLGSGWMGQLFKARHRTMDRVVALKILSSEATQSPELVARFRRKVSILARLRHENLVQAFDAGERDGTHYLIMEFVDGWDLTQLLKEFGTLPVEHVVDYILQAANGLNCAHENHVYHRNVKPSNILVDRSGIVKVIGLGVARFADHGLTESGVAAEHAEQQGRIIGTVDFMAPEQAADSAAADPRSDVYSLGCTMFSILTKRMLYAGKTTAEKIQLHRAAAIPSLTALRNDVAPMLDSIFQRMVAKRPELRFQSMKEVIAALKGAESAIANFQPMPVAQPVVQPTTARPAAVNPIAAPTAPAPQTPGGQDLAGFLGQLSQEPTWKRRR